MRNSKDHGWKKEQHWIIEGRGTFALCCLLILCAHATQHTTQTVQNVVCAHISLTALFSYDRRPDVNKSDDELRHELMQLRDVWNADQLELKKLHKVSVI